MAVHIHTPPSVAPLQPSDQVDSLCGIASQESTTCTTPSFVHKFVQDFVQTKYPDIVNVEVDSEMIASYNNSCPIFRANASRKRFTASKREHKRKEKLSRSGFKMEDYTDVYEFGHQLDLSSESDAEKYLTFLDAWFEDLIIPTKFENATDFANCWVDHAPHRLFALRILASHKNKNAHLFLRLHTKCIGERQFAKALGHRIEKQMFTSSHVAGAAVGLVAAITSYGVYRAFGAYTEGVRQMTPIANTLSLLNTTVNAVKEAAQAVIQWVQESIEALSQTITEADPFIKSIMKSFVLVTSVFLGFMYAKSFLPQQAIEVRSVLLNHYHMPEKQAWGDIQKNPTPAEETVDWYRQYFFDAPQTAFWKCVTTLPKLTTFAKSIEYVFTSSRYLYAAAREAFTGIPSPRCQFEQTVLDLEKQVRDTKSIVLKGVTEPILALEYDLIAMAAKRDAILATASKNTDIRPFIAGIIAVLKVDLDFCRRHFDRVRIAAEPRPMTVWLNIHGGQGTSKTTLVPQIMNSTHDLLIRMNAKFIKNKFQNTDVFVWDDAEDYWDAYGGQFYTVLDDLFQSEGTEERNPTARKIISMVAPFPMSLTCADMNMKGRIFFTSRALITTTNVSDFHTANLGLESPAALESRRTINVEILDGTHGKELFRLDQTQVLVDGNKHSHKSVINYDELVGLFAAAIIHRDKVFHEPVPLRVVQPLQAGFLGGRIYIPDPTQPYELKDVPAQPARIVTTSTPAHDQKKKKGKRRRYIAGPSKQGKPGEKKLHTHLTTRYDFVNEASSSTDKGKEKETECDPSFVPQDETELAPNLPPLIPQRCVSDLPLGEIPFFDQILENESNESREKMQQWIHNDFQSYCEGDTAIKMRPSTFNRFISPTPLQYHQACMYRFFLKMFKPYKYTMTRWADEKMMEHMMPTLLFRQGLTYDPARFFPHLPPETLRKIAEAWARVTDPIDFDLCDKKKLAEQFNALRASAAQFLVTWWYHFARTASPLSTHIDYTQDVQFPLLTEDPDKVLRFYDAVHTGITFTAGMLLAFTGLSILTGLTFTVAAALMPKACHETVEMQTYDTDPKARRKPVKKYVRTRPNANMRAHAILGSPSVVMQSHVTDRVKAITANLDKVTLHLSKVPVSNTEALALPSIAECWCLAIGGTRFLIPMHLILEKGDLTDVRYIGLKAKCTARFPLSEIKFIADLGGDVGVFEFPAQLSSRPRILEHFEDGDITNAKLAHIRPYDNMTGSTLIAALSWEHREDTVHSGESYPDYKTNFQIDGIPNEAGMCGTVYVNTITGKIVCMHMAGDRRAQRGYGVGILYNDIAPIMPSTLPNFEAPIKADLVQKQSAPGIQVLGGVPDKKYKVWISSETNLTESTFEYKTFPIPETTDLPAMLAPHGKPGDADYISPLKNAMDKLTSQTVSGAAPPPLGDYSGFLPKSFNRQAAGRVVTLLDAIYGIPGYTKGIDMKKSIGFFYKRMGFKNRTQLFPGRDAKQPINPIVEMEVTSRLEDARAGRPMKAGVIEENLKDEIRDRLRVKLGKTRMFSVYDLDTFLLTKMVFDCFFAELESDPANTPCTVGLDVHSSQWGDLYQKARGTLEEDRVPRDGDFGSYDFSHKFDGEDEFGTMVCQFHSEPDLVRVTIALNLRGCWHIVGEIVFLRPWGVSSGSFLTSVFNTFVNWLYHAKAWRALFPDISFSVVVGYFHGDDSFVTVPRKYQAYSCEYLSKFFRETYQMEYTAPDKGAIRERTWDDVTFLKRKFVPMACGYGAPLSLDSIANMIKWTEDPGDREVMSGVLQSALYEVFYHGPQLYREVFAWARQEVIRLNLTVTLLTFEEQLLQRRKRYR